MNNDMINCIPSKTMREYLMRNPATLSVFQQATIIDQYANDSDKKIYFQRLIEISDSEDERRLLYAEISGDFETSCRIYDERFPHEGSFPAYPLLEVCNLPVLFRAGDVIRHKNRLYYVGRVPYLVEGYCDFTDESYLCSSLYHVRKMNCKNYDELRDVHCHIGVCEAERVNYRRLNATDKHTAQRIRKIFEQRKSGTHIFSKPRRKISLS